MEETLGYKILPKVVYKISGDTNFINGITTNEMTKHTNAFLDTFGRLIAVVDQTFVGEDLYVVLEEKYEQAFLEHMNKYIKFVKAHMEKVALKVVHIIGKEGLGEMTIPKAIGYLALLKGVSALQQLKELSDKDYTTIRIENNISIQGIDFDNNMFLETNMDDTISYTKGCYLGQEVMSKVHNLGKAPKKLVRMVFDDLPEKVTRDGEDVGTITSSCFSPKYNKFLAFVMLKKYEEAVDQGEVI